MSKKEKLTCGPLYREGLESFAGRPLDPQLHRAFAAGFISGQAEKVYSGACSAAMLRPARRHRAMVSAIVSEVTERYQLYSYELLTEVGLELWICRTEEVAAKVMGLERETENSPAWHRSRALLCGIPWAEIDLDFHLRQGYGESCEPD